MGELLDVALMPHPPIMVPEIGRGELDKIKATLEATRKLAAEVTAARPGVVIIISPHGPVFRDAVGLWATPELSGSFSAFGAGNVKFSYKLNLELSESIATVAFENGIQTVWLDKENSKSYGLTPELDHGMMVPLYFLHEAGLDVPLVAMGISFLDRQKLYAFGTSIAKAVREGSSRALLVASGDLSHRLMPGAPAGYSPRGEVFDRNVKELLEKFDVEGILAIPEDLAESAGECGLRSFVMALGALDGYEVKGTVLSYEGPFGVGYLVAHFRPCGEKPLGRKVNVKESLPVRLARQSLEHYLRTGKVLPVPKPVPKELSGQAGVFVSLKKNGQLRGCIGTTAPTRKTLAEEIIYNALAAGLDDPRFPPVTVEELEDLQYSVDVLGESEPATLEDLDPKIYGVIVSKGRRRGLLLPNLEGVNTVEEQIAIACRKAGIDPGEPFELERFKVTRYY